MDHDATREQIELAAVEPGGLERLMAGDTAAAQAVAAHIAGCPACTDELARLGRAGPFIRATVREMPSPDLRARTLAAIRAEGVLRPIPAGAAAGPSLVTEPGHTRLAAPAPIPIGRRGRVMPVVGWLATIAAAVVLSIVTTSLIVGNRVDNQIAAQEETISALEEVTTTALAVNAEPDEQHVALTGVSNPALGGSLAFSPSTTELVWLATGLKPPTAGLEYRCWVEVDGTRHRVGKMFFSPELAYWVGKAPVVSGLSSGATFGVSLVDATGDSVSTEPVLLGTF